MRTGVLVILAFCPLLAVVAPALAGSSDGEPPPRHERSSAWSRLPPEQQESVRKNYARYANLPREKKARVRANYEHWKGMPPDRREHLRARYKKWQNMTDDQRAAVRARCSAGACQGLRKTGRSTCP